MRTCVCAWFGKTNEQIPWAKMLDPTSAAAFVGTAVASDDFGRCASGGGGGGGGGRSLAAIGPKKMMQVWMCVQVLGCVSLPCSSGSSCCLFPSSCSFCP